MKASNPKKPRLPFVNFLIAREYLQRDGQWNPRFKTPPFKGGLQINVFGAREHYRQLAEFFRQFAETAGDNSEYHEHFAGLMSADGLVRLHVILRKDDFGDSIWHSFFPPSTRRKKPSSRPRGVRNSRPASRPFKR